MRKQLSARWENSASLISDVRSRGILITKVRTQHNLSKDHTFISKTYKVRIWNLNSLDEFQPSFKYVLFVAKHQLRFVTSPT